MSINNGKQEKKYHTFLGRKYRIDKIPCGCSIPFNIELTKLHNASIELMAKLNPDISEDELYKELDKYVQDHIDEQEKQLKQFIRIASVITEFYTEGEEPFVDEKYIMREADAIEVTDFVTAIQECLYDDLAKKLNLPDRQ